MPCIYLRYESIAPVTDAIDSQHGLMVPRRHTWCAAPSNRRFECKILQTLHLYMRKLYKIQEEKDTCAALREITLLPHTIYESIIRPRMRSPLSSAQRSATK